VDLYNNEADPPKYTLNTNIAYIREILIWLTLKTSV